MTQLFNNNNNRSKKKINSKNRNIIIFLLINIKKHNHADYKTNHKVIFFKNVTFILNFTHGVFTNSFLSLYLGSFFYCERLFFKPKRPNPIKDLSLVFSILRQRILFFIYIDIRLYFCNYLN